MFLDKGIINIIAIVIESIPRAAFVFSSGVLFLLILYMFFVYISKRSRGCEDKIEKELGRNFIRIAQSHSCKETVEIVMLNKEDA